MATTILTHNSATTTNVPANLAQGELAVNTADQKLWVGDGTATPVPLITLAESGWTEGTDPNDITNTNSGNVGIGTPTPSQPLSVVGIIESVNTGSNPSFTLTRDGSQNGLLFGTATQTILRGDASEGIIFRANDAAGILRFDVGSATERMRITSVGFVGVGTTSPTTGLEVASIGNTSTGITFSQWGTNTSNMTASLRTQRANSGTVGTHSGFLQGTRLIGSLEMDASDGTAFVNSGYIRLISATQHSASNTDSLLTFAVTPTGTKVPVEALRIDSDGIVTGLWNNFGTSNPLGQFQKLTQAEYDGITPDADTIYYIVG